MMQIKDQDLCKSADAKLDQMELQQIDLKNELLRRQQNDIDSVNKKVKSSMSDLN